MVPDAQRSSFRKVGVVTGLASEAVVANALLGDSEAPVVIACAGASTDRAAARARQLVESGVEALLSFGIAGATDTGLQSGDLLIAREVTDDELDLYPCDGDWQERLCAALDEARVPYRRARLLGSRKLWRDSGDKEAIAAMTEAQGVDMESGAVAAVAAEAGLPFLAVRAIADTARDDLPALVENAVRPDGMPAIGRAVAGLIRRPWELRAVLRLARQSELALARLRMLESVKSALFGGF